MFMRKLILIALIALTGCTNPIASSINKEGDKTRIELQAEFATAKQELSAENRAMIEQLSADMKNNLGAIVDYLNYLSFLQTKNAIYPGDLR